MPKKYELIPLAAEAIQITPDSVHRAALWCGGVEAEEIDPFDSTIRNVGLNVPTISGIHRCSQGDYVVRDPLTNVFSVMSQHEFEKKYRLVG